MDQTMTIEEEKIDDSEVPTIKKLDEATINKIGNHLRKLIIVK